MNYGKNLRMETFYIKDYNFKTAFNAFASEHNIVDIKVARERESACILVFYLEE